MNRRQFMTKSASFAAAAVGFPYILSASAFGKNSVLPGSKITMASIGIGWQGETNLKAFLEEPDVKVVAVCDLDKTHLAAAKQLVDEKYGNKDCATYSDFREVLARNDIDAVVISIPDHWHAVVAVAAAKAGKDVFGEKPIAHKLAQGRAICNAIEKYQRIWQTGSWQRSIPHFALGSHLVRNGRIGKVKVIDVTLPSGHVDFFNTGGLVTISPPPEELDYDRWLGPAPYAPYCPARVHRNWRWIMDYGGGMLTDWIGHHADIGLWGLGMDKMAPVEVEATGTWPADGLWNAPLTFSVEAKYENGVVMNIRDITHVRSEHTGTVWHGENGWIRVNRQDITASDPAILQEKGSASDIELYEVPLRYRTSHYRNFIDSVKSRRQAIAPAISAHNAVIPGQLGLISMQLNRKLRFDPKTEKIIGDPEANRLLNNPFRSPWHL